MTLEPDRRGHPSVGHHGYPLARASAPKLARSGEALHLQASSQLTVRIMTPAPLTPPCNLWVSALVRPRGLAVLNRGGDKAVAFPVLSFTGDFRLGSMLSDSVPKQDSAAAAGLRVLEKRVEAVPVAVYEFLQAGGVPAAVTIITSEPVHMELREAAVSLLIAVARKQPQALSLAFL